MSQSFAIRIAATWEFSRNYDHQGLVWLQDVRYPPIQPHYTYTRFFMILRVMRLCLQMSCVHAENTVKRKAA